VPEADVFVCESLYDEARRQIKKFEGLKKYQYMDARVHRDELYVFRRTITLAKVDLDGSIIPEMPKLKVATKIEHVSFLLNVLCISIYFQNYTFF
jgi:hypothetical protein